MDDRTGYQKETDGAGEVTRGERGMPGRNGSIGTRFLPEKGKQGEKGPPRLDCGSRWQRRQQLLPLSAVPIGFGPRPPIHVQFRPTEGGVCV